MNNQLKNELLSDVPIKLMKVDPRYQRVATVSWKRINKIKNNYNDKLIGTLMVSKREDGYYYVIDGQHRFLAMKELNIEVAPCRIFFNLTVEEEAKLFDDFNSLVKRLTQYELYNPRDVYKDKATLEIKEILSKYNFIISNKKDRKNTISSIGALYDIHKKLTEEQFSRVFYLLRATWDGNSKSLNHTIIYGMGNLINKVGFLIKDVEFVNKLKNIDPEEVVRKGRMLAKGGYSYIAFSRVLLDYYNSYKKEENKINPDLLLSIK